MPRVLPLPTLLSQTLVALTIELDNELELRMPHFICHEAARSCGLRPLAGFLGDVGEPSHIARAAAATRSQRRSISDGGMHIALEGMTRWGYVGTGTYQKGGQWKTAAKDALVTLTPAGTSAQGFFRLLPAVVETGWRDRFGGHAVERLRASLHLFGRPGLPTYLPIARYPTGLRAEVAQSADAWRETGDGDDELVTLLARVLLGFTLDYEGESELSLAIAANFLHALDGDGELVRELPRVTGASKEAVTFCVGFLEKGGYAEVAPDPGSPRAKRARLTPKGVEAAAAHAHRLTAGVGVAPAVRRPGVRPARRCARAARGRRNMGRARPSRPGSWPRQGPGARRANRRTGCRITLWFSTAAAIPTEPERPGPR